MDIDFLSLNKRYIKKSVFLMGITYKITLVPAIYNSCIFKRNLKTSDTLAPKHGAY